MNGNGTNPDVKVVTVTIRGRPVTEVEHGDTIYR
jgi:hypothetical protein